MIEREVNFHDIVKPITGVRELQLAYEKFSSYINPEQTPSSLLEHVKEEVAELDEAIQKGDRKDVASEVADVMLFTVEIANKYHIDLEEVLGGKLTRNYHKYNPIRLRELLEQGLTPGEAKSKMKTEWNREHDKLFIK